MFQSISILYKGPSPTSNAHALVCFSPAHWPQLIQLMEILDATTAAQRAPVFQAGSYFPGAVGKC